MDNNAEFVSDLSVFLNGRETVGYIKEHVFAMHAVNKKIFAKSVLWTYNLDFQWTFEIKDVEKMVNIY
jgi:hypothetical protein